MINSTFQHSIERLRGRSLVANYYYALRVSFIHILFIVPLPLFHAKTNSQFAEVCELLNSTQALEQKK